MAETYFGSEPYAQLFNYEGGPYQGPGAAPLASSSPQVQALIDQGLITRTQHQGQNESGSFDFSTDNFNAFDPRAQGAVPKATYPNTSFNWVPIGSDPNNSMRKLIDPTLTYHDPNYGWVTPSFNDKSNLGDWQDYIGPLVMGAVTLGAGALASAGVGAASGLSAAEAGAGAGAAGAGYSGAAGLYSTPWYLPAGQSVARQIGSGNPTAAGIGSALIPGLEQFGIPSYLGTAASAVGNLFKPEAKAVPMQPMAQPAFNPMSTYNPQAFGDMNSMNAGAVSDGSQRVATAVAPDAYGNSYNSVTT